MEDELSDLQLYLCILLPCLIGFDDILQVLAQMQTLVNTFKNMHKRKRTPDSALPFHFKRKRQLWSPLVRSLGPAEFKRHHRISIELFDKIHKKIEASISTKSKYARKTCCRGKISAVDSRSRLSMTLKHLAGSKIQDIERTHGVSRSTVTQSIYSTLDAIIAEFPIDVFPFDDVEFLQKIADGFRSKSTGGLFNNVVGVFDGFLLRISKRCIGNKSGINDPSKYYCRKGYYAVNCQVCCDANRKILSLSMLCPGAVPDRLAHSKSKIHRAIETGQLPEPFHFVGDNAYPASDQLFTPCKRTELRDDAHGYLDNYNFYLSQIRINIECCFGMMINKFPILETALTTTKLETATKVFTVCCILHNLCIDERIINDNLTAQSFPTGKRYTQNADSDPAHGLLTNDSDFEYVQTVDETVAAELINLQENAGTNNIVPCTDNLSAKERMIYKIAASGYVRPRRIG